MRNNNVKVIIKNRSSVDRQMVEHSLSFFKLHVDRRRVKDRRSFLKQEYLDHNPERRVNMIGGRRIGDRRGILARYYEYFVGKRALIFKRPPFGK